MENVIITMLDGKKMSFPKQYADKVIKKNKLVTTAMFYQMYLKESDLGNTPYNRAVKEKLEKIMRQIRSLNRQIPPCGTVVS